MRRGNIKALGAKIKKLRKQQDLLQVELADKAGISYGYVSSIEQGLRYPSLKVLQKLARVLKTDIKNLL